MNKANHSLYIISASINNESDFNELLKTKDRVMMLIYASWCPFCVRFLPVFEKQAQEREDMVMVQDNQEIIADKYEVNVVPTILLFENGILTNRLDGVLGIGLSEKGLLDFINNI